MDALPKLELICERLFSNESFHATVKTNSMVKDMVKDRSRKTGFSDIGISGRASVREQDL
jgi:hypothetical protein